MAKALQVDVIPPGSCNEDSAPVDDSLADQADKLLYAEMPTRDKVWVLHFLQGWTLRKIGKALGVSHQAIHKHAQNIEAELDASPADAQVTRRRTVVRERLEAQYARAMGIDDTEKSIIFALKTLEVMAKLDGLNLEAQEGGQKLVPYAPPAEIAGDVRVLMGKRWGIALPVPDKDQGAPQQKHKWRG